MAVRQKKAAVVRALLLLGAWRDAKSRRGETPEEPRHVKQRIVVEDAALLPQAEKLGTVVHRKGVAKTRKHLFY